MSAILAAGEPRPDCVFAVTDVMAMGALARLRAGGLQVPADIALAGFDDIATLRDVHPPLTTVRLPLKRIGEMAASLVLSRGRGGARRSAARHPRPGRGHAARQHAAAPAGVAPLTLADPGRRSCTFRSIGKRLPTPGRRAWPAAAGRDGARERRNAAG